LRMSLTVSLEAVGVCLAGVSMIVLSLVLAFYCIIVLSSLQPFRWPLSCYIVASA
jgi:hypothetical protein